MKVKDLKTINDELYIARNRRAFPKGIVNTYDTKELWQGQELISREWDEAWDEAKIGPPEVVDELMKMGIEISALYKKCFLPKMKAEIHRKNVENMILALLRKRAPWMIIDPQNRRTLMQTLIGNFIMCKADTVEGPKFTASAWLPQSDGYLGADNIDSVPDFIPAEQEVSTAEMTNMMKDIFDGQGKQNDQEAYLQQVKKIYAHAPKILRFLASHQMVPENLRTLTSTMADPESLVQKFLDRSGPIFDQDINTVNRFLCNGGLDLAQKVMVYSQVFDFVRGVETNLVLSTCPLSERLKQMFGGKWKNSNFSQESDHMIEENIAITLKDGEHRMHMLDNNKKVKNLKRNWLLKDWQEYLEKVFCWDINDMKFLRWSSYWDAYNILMRVSDECICRYRKNLYNPMMLKQA